MRTTCPYRVDVRDVGTPCESANCLLASLLADESVMTTRKACDVCLAQPIAPTANEPGHVVASLVISATWTKVVRVVDGKSVYVSDEGEAQYRGVFAEMKRFLQRTKKKPCPKCVGKACSIVRRPKPKATKADTPKAIRPFGANRSSLSKISGPFGKAKERR